MSRRFRNIARTAPDVLEVVVATLGNPLAGFGVAVKKITEKAKEETKQTLPFPNSTDYQLHDSKTGQASSLPCFGLMR